MAKLSAIPMNEIYQYNGKTVRKSLSGAHSILSIIEKDRVGISTYSSTDVLYNNKIVNIP